MAKIVREDLWKPVENAVYVVTTNGTLRKDGSVVMGRGAALEATKRYPGIDKILGDQIKKFFSYGPHYRYGYIEVNYEGQRIGAFQVKYFWGDAASLEIIKHSIKEMILWFSTEPKDLPVRMNYPGIGNGRLKREDVEPLLAGLPDNVTICYK